MTRRLFQLVGLSLISLIVGACELRRAPGTLITRSPDPAVSLAARLPRGADQCVVARTGRLSRQQAALLGPLTRSHLALAWSLPVPLSAYAEVARRLPGGVRRREIWLQSGDPSALREHLLRRAPMRVAEASSCQPAREWCLDDRGGGVFRLHHGPWGPAEFDVAGIDHHPDVSMGCGRRLAANPELLEVALGQDAGERADELDLDGQRAGFGQVGQLLYDAGGGVRLLVTVGPISSDGLEPLLRGPFEAFERVHGARADAVRRSFDGRMLRLTASYLWEDLAFQAADAEFVREAERAEQGEGGILPAAEVDTSDSTLVAQQLRLRRAALADAEDDDEARVRARPLYELLLRAYESSPGDGSQVGEALELALWPLRDADAVLGLLDDFLGPEESSYDPFPRIRRQALALRVAAATRGVAEVGATGGATPEVGATGGATTTALREAEEALSAALRAAGIAVEAGLTDFLARAASEGGRFDYPAAEDGWRRLVELRAHRERVRPLREPATLPASSLFETLLALAEQGPSGFEPPVRAALWYPEDHELDRAVFLRPAGVTVHGTSICLGLRLGQGGRAKVGEGRQPSPDGLFGWTRCLAPQRSGPFVAMLQLEGGDPIVIEGVAREGEVEVRAATSRGLDWAAVARWVARPLASWSAGSFPRRGTLEVHGAPAQTRAQVAERLASQEFRCENADEVLRCTVERDRRLARTDWVAAVRSRLAR